MPCRVEFRVHLRKEKWSSMGYTARRDPNRLK
ncbi:hypothetical protein T03_7176 [Trichinella britovi]|uniref:Uncharacterized protein n=1 Tax=Trichinella britovi TaxID=45882 RepID=A0A0V0YW67_TRIBR|nr:hypothetical protein T03_7176 [Trichinella britovi]